MDLGVWAQGDRKLEKLKGKTGKWHAVWMVVKIMMILLIYFQTNSVPYDASEMKSIESSVLSHILNSSCSDYIITA